MLLGYIQGELVPVDDDLGDCRVELRVGRRQGVNDFVEIPAERPSGGRCTPRLPDQAAEAGRVAGVGDAEHAATLDTERRVDRRAGDRRDSLDVGRRLLRRRGRGFVGWSGHRANLWLDGTSSTF